MLPWSRHTEKVLRICGWSARPMCVADPRRLGELAVDAPVLDVEGRQVTHRELAGGQHRDRFVL